MANRRPSLANQPPNGKGPRVLTVPVDGKTPRASENPDSYKSRCLSWRIGMLDTGHAEWGWSAIPKEILWTRIHATMKGFETMPWNELEGKKHCHSMEVSDLDRAAQERLTEIKFRHDTVYQLGFTGRERLWGVREGSVFNVLWWDANHTVYPVEKKNT